MNRGKKARKGEKQKGGKKGGHASEGGPTSPTEEKGEEDFIPPPTQVREGVEGWDRGNQITINFRR